eukprot:g18623.t1
MALQDRVRAHQEAAPKLDAATEVRSLVQYNHGFAVMSTNSASMPGYPGGSVVGFAVDDVQNVRFVGGFARAGTVTAEAYASAAPDPIAGFGPAVAGHMNDDHREATIAMIRKFIGIEVEDAEITSMDSLGMHVKVSRKPKAADQMQQFKLRLPFTRKLETRKE